jgi:hypothetical protein
MRTGCGFASGNRARIAIVIVLATDQLLDRHGRRGHRTSA